MFSAFSMGPAVGGLCDIYRLLFKVMKSRIKQLGSPGTTKIYRKLGFYDLDCQ